MAQLNAPNKTKGHCGNTCGFFSTRMLIATTRHHNPSMPIAGNILAVGMFGLSRSAPAATRHVGAHRSKQGLGDKPHQIRHQRKLRRATMACAAAGQVAAGASAKSWKRSGSRGRATTRFFVRWFKPSSLLFARRILLASPRQLGPATQSLFDGLWLGQASFEQFLIRVFEMAGQLRHDCRVLDGGRAPRMPRCSRTNAFQSGMAYSGEPVKCLKKLSATPVAAGQAPFCRRV